MSKFTIIVGTMLGASEYVADHLQALLTDAGHQADVLLEAQLEQLDLNNPGIWLVCTSTHGAGDLPDNIQPFVDAINSHSPDLTQIQYAVCGLGDSSYDTFCHGGKTLDDLLATFGAKRITEMLSIDMIGNELPEDKAEAWMQNWLPKVS